MNAGDIRFALPSALWALAILPVLVGLYIRAAGLRRVMLSRFIAARLQPRLAGTVSIAKRLACFILALLAVAGGILAVARPQWGVTWEEVRQKGRDVLIAVDTSRSMLAQDLRPDRLTRAKLAAQDLLAQLGGDRAGVIAFAGTAFLQAPLTPDHDAVREALNGLDTEILPRGGTSLTAAIQEAAEAFQKGESQHQALIIFSDGEELELDAVAAAREHKFKVFTVGIGSREGVLIPEQTRLGGTEFVRDESGQPVKTRLDEARMREVADAGGGFYVHLQNGPAEMSQIVREGLGKMNAKESDARVAQQAIERYQWPLGAAILCALAALVIGDRRRMLRAAVAVSLAMASAQAAAAGDQQFAAHDYRGALESFEAGLQKRDVPELHFNAGAAAFQLGDYERAAAGFSKALGSGTTDLQARAAYNLANTLARRGARLEKSEEKLTEWRNALQHYDRALELAPTNKDCEVNREIVKKAIERLEKQEQQKKDEEKKDGEKKDGEKQDGEKQDGEKQDGEKQDGEKQDGEKKDGEKKDGEKKDGDKKDGDKKDGEDGSKQDLQPQPGEKGEKKDGELKPAGDSGQDPDKDAKAGEAAEAMAAALEKRMTEKDAQALLESLRRLDVRGRLSDPKDARRVRDKAFKNW